MVLVDTSVWIRFLGGVEPYASGLADLLANDEVLRHEFVYGELLIGDRGGRATLLAEYSVIRSARTVPHAEVKELVKHRRLYGTGIGWIDAHLLASVLVERSALWTADKPLLEISRSIGVAYQA